MIKWTIKNIAKVFAVFIISLIINIISRLDFIILETNNLIAYTGSMMGFALTIYTFGISILGQIKDLIRKSTKIKEDNKLEYVRGLLNAFAELKEDVGAIAFTLVLVIITSTLQSLNTMNIELDLYLSKFKTIGYFNLYTTIKLFTFLLSSWMFLDLTKSMLNISQIYQELIKEDQ